MPDETGAYLLVRRVCFELADLAVEVSLELSHAGEEYVTAVLVTANESGSRRSTETEQRTAHTGYQMRRALDLQDEAIRKKLVTRTRL